MSLSKRPARTTYVAAAAIAATLSLSFGGQAIANGLHDQTAAVPPAVPAPPAAPTSDDQIQNIDQVRTAIKAYYGDTTTTTTDPVNGTTALHTYAPGGAYDKQVRGLVRTWEHKILKAAPGVTTPAIVLDVDDTSVNTYNYEVYSNFAYNPTSNAAFVNSAAFPKVPGMPGLARLAASKGITLLFLTGRPETQRAGTVTNLADAGFPAVPDDQLILKDQTAPYLSSCAPSCTTIQYKTLSRQQFESEGYDIIGNFGDQYSDLSGGHADATYKLPNPMYYLP